MTNYAKRATKGTQAILWGLASTTFFLTTKPHSVIQRPLVGENWPLPLGAIEAAQAHLSERTKHKMRRAVYGRQRTEEMEAELAQNPIAPNL
ncbi:hypothetical protein Lgee_0249 [Legionella geestiana]|uniref:Uncharacterized protein n=1 Tax=Legionella geestiana TaxID=45065 RepID=A0A0W0U8X4_9GAMM|nr:hypothetical protein [Legionella geestiana]KTD04219.1 hypothetical protein Lgee_0249 [Legionella geestiana]QBS11641.1 hypothetical protein E4T54_02180 [Legionella geestiana]QDQ40749.1 hypothetical protein E3226_010245 [Legionella geestiana]STX53676.1 Uncharacterised protein [Legionella geestiana]